MRANPMGTIPRPPAISAKSLPPWGPFRAPFRRVRLDTALACWYIPLQRGRGEAGYRAGLSSRRPRVQVPSLPLFYSLLCKELFSDSPHC